MKTFTFIDWLFQSGCTLLNFSGNAQYHSVLLGLFYLIAIIALIGHFSITMIKLSGVKVKKLLPSRRRKSKHNITNSTLC
jgi:hypothetical protein